MVRIWPETELHAIFLALFSASRECLGFFFFSCFNNYVAVLMEFRSSTSALMWRVFVSLGFESNLWLLATLLCRVC
jgi:hypothetical protein